MAKRADKEKAIKLRLKGLSYSQIREQIKVSKGTLSAWLKKYPLSSERIKELRDFSPRRIESFRNTMAKKRADKLDAVYLTESKKLGKLTKREILIGGLFLYWGEGGKTARSTIALSNTDPAMLIFYLKWLEVLGVPFDKLKMVIHMYKDMDKNEVVKYWSKTLGLPKSNFRVYIKKSNQSDLTYKTGFGHGTCMIRYGNQEMADRVMMSLKYIQNYFL